MTRRSCAAPFVVVIACRSSAAPEPREPIHEAPPPRVVAVPADPDRVAPAPEPEPVLDAAVVADQDEACEDPEAAYRLPGILCAAPPWPKPRPPEGVCKDPALAERRWGVRCNPPPPPAATEVETRVIAVQPHGAGVLVTLALDSSDGVGRGDRGTLIDGAGRPIKGGRLVITRVTSRIAVAAIALAAVPSGARAGDADAVRRRPARHTPGDGFRP